ncbi:unnamed protein product, partial [Discosporangium mesarthrocarpum]
LGHLTNGLLQQRLNPEGYDPSKHVWTTDQLLQSLTVIGVDWLPIQRQVR